VTDPVCDAVWRLRYELDHPEFNPARFDWQRIVLTADIATVLDALRAERQLADDLAELVRDAGVMCSCPWPDDDSEISHRPDCDLVKKRTVLARWEARRGD
jgi:hypothetical protein